MEHLGLERVVQLCRVRFFWPRMQDDITHFVTKVCNCLKQRKHVPIRAPSQSFVASSPFKLISIDFMHLEKSSGGYEYILLIADSFTRFAQAYPCKNKSAHTAANKIYNDFILRFGFPSRIDHDQETEFENDLFHQLEKLCGVVRSRTTPYHPHGNRQVEKMNRTLISMLRTLPVDQKGKWKDHLNKVIHAYNSTKHEATGYSPFFLLFGRSPRQPIDLIFDTYPSSTPTKYRDFVKNWKTAMQEAYALANERSVKSLAKGRDYHDRKATFTGLKPGDRVLVRNLTLRGSPGKLRSFWEDKMHIVIGRKGDNSPVYDVQKESDPNAKVRTLHRNLLLPCDFFLVEQPSQSVRNLKQKTETNHKPKVNKSSKEDLSYDYDDDYNDSDGLNPHQQKYFADYLSRQQEQSAQVKQVEQEEHPQPIDHNTLTDEENELAADAADVAEANTAENEDVEPSGQEIQEIQEQPDSVAQPTTPDQEVIQGRPQRNRQPPDYLGYNRFGSPYYIHHLPVDLRATVPQYHCTPYRTMPFIGPSTSTVFYSPYYNPYVLSSLPPYQIV